MALHGNILIADDDDTFLLSTCDLLRREGFVCEAVSNGRAAAEALERRHFDLLIADIRMAGNGNLELLRAVQERESALPVIIVTGYPSVETAVEAIDLRVEAYLVKPFDFYQLRDRVAAAVQRYRVLRTVESAQGRLANWQQDISGMVSGGGETAGRPMPATTSVFVNLTLRNIIGSLNDLESLLQLVYTKEPQQHVCELFNCPRAVLLQDSIVDAIHVLEETRTSFKSKELGALRQRLGATLRTNQDL
jgi:CheY-like chemotaxis protein